MDPALSHLQSLYAKAALDEYQKNQGQPSAPASGSACEKCGRSQHQGAACFDPGDFIIAWGTIGKFNGRKHLRPDQQILMIWW